MGRRIVAGNHELWTKGDDSYALFNAQDGGGGEVTGNTYDKYGSTNPVVKRLMAGFERTLDELFHQAAPRSVLDVGCGEGVLTHKWAQRIEGPAIIPEANATPVVEPQWRATVTRRKVSLHANAVTNSEAVPRRRRVRGLAHRMAFGLDRGHRAFPVDRSGALARVELLVVHQRLEAQVVQLHGYRIFDPGPRRAPGS